MKYRIGVNGHLASRALLDLAAQAGWHSVRGDFNWADIQPEPDPNPEHWRWGPTDAWVYGCRERDIEVFATLAYTPNWANGEQGRYVPPHHVEDWRRFVRAVADATGTTSGIGGSGMSPTETFSGERSSSMSR